MRTRDSFPPRLGHDVAKTDAAVTRSSCGKSPAPTMQDTAAVGGEAVRVDEVSELGALLYGNHSADGSGFPNHNMPQARSAASAVARIASGRISNLPDSPFSSVSSTTDGW